METQTKKEAPTYIPVTSPVLNIDCEQAFNGLTLKEKL